MDQAKLAELNEKVVQLNERLMSLEGQVSSPSGAPLQAQPEQPSMLSSLTNSLPTFGFGKGGSRRKSRRSKKSRKSRHSRR